MIRLDDLFIIGGARQKYSNGITINCCPALLSALSALLTSGLSPFPAIGRVPCSDEALNFFDDFFVWGKLGNYSFKPFPDGILHRLLVMNRAMSPYFSGSKRCISSLRRFFQPLRIFDLPPSTSNILFICSLLLHSREGPSRRLLIFWFFVHSFSAILPRVLQYPLFFYSEWNGTNFRDFPWGCDILITFRGSESESEYSLSVPSSSIFDSSLVIEDPSVA